MISADLELSLRRDGATYAVDLRFTPAGSRAPVRLITGGPAVAPLDEAALAELDGAAADLGRYGALLTGLLFADQRLAEALTRARTAAESAGSALRLRLALDEREPGLHRLRWETLRDPSRPGSLPLAADERVLLSRFLSSDDLQPVRSPAQAELRAVVAIANPSGLAAFQLAPLDVFCEAERAESALAAIPAAFLSQAHGRPTTLPAIADALRDGADILYLVCHGTLLGDTSYLWLEGDTGKIARVTGAEFAAQIRALARRPLLAVLASCRSAGDASGATLAALGPLLIAAGVPAVVAMQDDVALDTVAAFLPALFRELRRDGCIDRAVAAARAALGESDGWWQPVLWMRLADGRLWAGTEPAQASPAPAQPTHNLPAFPTPLVGREREVAAICALVRSDAARLVTVVGPGGVGKTRLAAQAAWELIESFPAGARFVNLTEVTSEALLASAIAQALGIQESGAGSLEGQIAAHLRERRMLLVLDNFEQIVAAAPLVARLLAAAPRVEIICTSREPLRILGEHEYHAPPLPTPDPQALPREAGARLQAIAASPAATLFIARAQAVKPAFALTAASADAVAEICRQVDGLPLAIELAAARCKLFSPQAILTRLTSRLTLLTGGARELAAHQQTLRGTIAWSYDLLSSGEQALLARLGVFAGGCTIAAAEAICAPGPELGLDPLDGLSSLVDKSLLRQSEQADGEPRFQLLATIREFALERLLERGEGAELERRHASHYAGQAAAAEPAILGPGQQQAMEELSREHDNLRAALAWLEANDGARMAATCSALWRFWYVRCHFHEGRDWIARALATSDGEDGLLFANLLSGAATLAFAQSDLAQAGELYERSLALRQRLGDRDGVARTLNNLGNVAIRCGEYALASTRYQDATALFRQQGVQGAVLATLLNNLGLATLYLGEAQLARSAFEEGLAHARAAGDSRMAAYALNNLGLAQLGEGLYEQSRRSFVESLALQQALGSREGAAASQNNLGYVALREGDPLEASKHFNESMLLRRELGDRAGVAACLEGFACVAAALGELRRSARLAGTAATLRARLGAPAAPHEQALYTPSLELVRQALGEQEYLAALAEGGGLSVEDALDETLLARQAAP